MIFASLLFEYSKDCGSNVLEIYSDSPSVAQIGTDSSRKQWRSNDQGL